MARSLSVSLIVLAIGVSTVTAGAPAQPAAAWQEFQKFYRDSLNQHAIVGSSVALLRQGAVVERLHEGLRLHHQDLYGNRDHAAP